MPLVNAHGVVLSRRDFGESDRLAAVYTRELGKIMVRFVGVKKPGRKLKTFCEPLSQAEFRLYLSHRSETATAAGGAFISIFRGLRQNLERLTEGLWCLELLEAITPLRSPNPRKFDLLVETLSLMESSASSWLRPAFGLRLLELAGFGLRGLALPPAQKTSWLRLHDLELPRLPGLPTDAEALGRFMEIIENQVQSVIDRPLRLSEFRRSLSKRTVVHEPVC